MFPRTTDPIEGREELSGLYGTGLWYLSRDMREGNHIVGPMQRYSFWLAFDLLPDEQEALERLFSGLDLGRARFTTDEVWEDDITPLAAPL
jgi:hypothetical protein